MRTEDRVLAIFEAHLPGRRVEAGADLFALGVDSLTAVRIGLELERTFGVVIAPELFVSHPTPGALARWIDGHGPGPAC